MEKLDVKVPQAEFISLTGKNSILTFKYPLEKFEERSNGTFLVIQPNDISGFVKSSDVEVTCCEKDWIKRFNRIRHPEKYRWYIHELFTKNTYMDFESFFISDHDEYLNTLIMAIEAVEICLDDGRKNPSFNAMIDTILVMISDRISNDEKYTLNDVIDITDHVHNILTTKYITSSGIDWTQINKNNIEEKLEEEI